MRKKILFPTIDYLKSEKISLESGTVHVALVGNGPRGSKVPSSKTPERKRTRRES